MAITTRSATMGMSMQNCKGPAPLVCSAQPKCDQVPSPMVHFSSRSFLDLNVYTNVHKLPSGAPEFLLHIEIEARAASVLAEYGPLSALIVLPQDESVCCRVGFDVVALPEGDAIPPELVEIGMA